MCYSLHCPGISLMHSKPKYYRHILMALHLQPQMFPLLMLLSVHLKYRCCHGNIHCRQGSRFHTCWRACKFAEDKFMPRSTTHLANDTPNTLDLWLLNPMPLCNAPAATFCSERRDHCVQCLPRSGGLP